MIPLPGSRFLCVGRMSLTLQKRAIRPLITQAHDFAGGEASGFDAREEIAGDALGTVEGAMFEDVAVVRGRVANLRVIGIAAQRFGVAVLEEARARAPHEVHVSFDVAVGDISLTVDL